MERRQLEYLVGIERSGGFGKAAEQLHVTQSALSQAIGQLERELGVELFHRRVRPVRLTAAGEAVLEPARQTLRGFSTILHAASSVSGLASGHLDIATLPTLAQWPATPLVARFRAEHPGVRIHILGPSEPRTAELATMIRRGVCEIGLTEHKAFTEELVEVPLGSHDYVAVLPPGSGVPADGTVDYEHVLAMGLIVGPWWETSRPYLAIRQHCPELVDEAVVVRIDHRETYVPLVLAGAGAALLPRFVAEMAEAAGATVAELEMPITRELVLVHRDSSLTPAARAFRDLAARSPATPAGSR